MTRFTQSQVLITISRSCNCEDHDSTFENIPLGGAAALKFCTAEREGRYRAHARAMDVVIKTLDGTG